MRLQGLFFLFYSVFFLISDETWMKTKTWKWPTLQPPAAKLQRLEPNVKCVFACCLRCARKEKDMLFLAWIRNICKGTFSSLQQQSPAESAAAAGGNKHSQKFFFLLHNLLSSCSEAQHDEGKIKELRGLVIFLDIFFFKAQKS